MRLYSYSVGVPGFPDCGEELDVHAGSQAEADRLARVEADDLYGEDSTLRPIEAGGSGGLFQILRL